MKRSMLAMVITGVLALAMGPVVAESPREASVPTSDATSAAVPCSDSERLLVLGQSGCCQREGGVCGCRNGTPKCCNGTMGSGCRCRGNTAGHEAIFIDEF
jgi:hypothetical protein